MTHPEKHALPLLFAALAIVMLFPRANAATAVDLELVIAVDASLSIDDDEFRLQLQGIARALRDATVQAAITSGPRKQIAVDLALWADATGPKDQTGWFLLSTAQSIEAFARQIEQAPRTVTGSTGIGSAIAYAIGLMQASGMESPRRIIDVSGDGIETPRTESTTVLLPQAHAMAARAGVTINGLALMTETSGLDAWYREHVMFGPDSFVTRARDLEDFPEAMREKLVREIQSKLSQPMLETATSVASLTGP